MKSLSNLRSLNAPVPAAHSGLLGERAVRSRSPCGGWALQTGVYEIQAVREPGTWLLVPTAVGLAWLARKRRREVVADRAVYLAEPSIGTSRQ